MSKKEFDIIIEKNYTDLTKKTDPTIGLIMMCKNEKLRMQVSLDSVTDTVDCMIIYDTGSTDNTIDIVKDHCEKH